MKKKIIELQEKPHNVLFYLQGSNSTKSRDECEIVAMVVRHVLRSAQVGRVESGHVGGRVAGARWRGDQVGRCACWGPH